MIGLRHDGELDLVVRPVWKGEAGTLRNKSCVERNDAPSPVCRSATTENKVAWFYYEGTLRALQVKAVFGEESRMRALVVDNYPLEQDHRLLFEWGK